MRSRCLWFAGLLLAALPAASCDRIGGATVPVEFSQAPPLEPGADVYLKGIAIGQVGKSQLGPGGKVVLPLHLTRSATRALASSTVLVVTADRRQPGRNCLEAFVVDANSGRIDERTTFRGANGMAELIAETGAEMGSRIWKAITAGIDSLQ